MNHPAMRTGGRILIDALCRHGVDTVFCVPGESYLAALDALYDVRDKIKLIVCRHEGGAAYMAEAYGKMTGRPGICFVTRGPGASNATIGIHTAFQDSTPMLLFIGQVARDQKDREAFQEVEYRQMFAPLCKWVTEIDDAARIPELVGQAFHRAVNGRPGPVVVALPEDMLREKAAVMDSDHYQVARAAPSSSQLEEFQALLEKAERPLLIAGGGGWSGEAVSYLQQLIEAADLPAAASFRCQDLIDNDHPNYVGDAGIGINPKLAKRMRESDLLIALGTRLGEITTSGYSLVKIPTPDQKLVHIHASAEELGRVYRPHLAIQSGMKEFCEAAKAAIRSKQRWSAWTREARADYLEWSTPSRIASDIEMGEIMVWLRDRLPSDGIVTNGAGNYASWIHRFFRYRKFRSQLAPTNGSMGYGVPAAIAAKIAAPGRLVVSFSGDGCFLMNGQELATAVQYNLAVIFIVVNNGMYGTIRMHQEQNYPDRVSGTGLTNPDFAALAAAYGILGQKVTRTEEFAPAFEKAVECGGPALIEIRLDPEIITPRASLSEIRQAAKKRIAENAR